MTIKYLACSSEDTGNNGPTIRELLDSYFITATTPADAVIKFHQFIPSKTLTLYKVTIEKLSEMTPDIHKTFVQNNLR